MNGFNKLSSITPRLYTFLVLLILLSICDAVLNILTINYLKHFVSLDKKLIFLFGFGFILLKLFFLFFTRFLSSTLQLNVEIGLRRYLLDSGHHTVSLATNDAQIGAQSVLGISTVFLSFIYFVIYTGKLAITAENSIYLLVIILPILPLFNLYRKKRFSKIRLVRECRNTLADSSPIDNLNNYLELTRHYKSECYALIKIDLFWGFAVYFISSTLILLFSFYMRYGVEELLVLVLIFSKMGHVFGSFGALQESAHSVGKVLNAKPEKPNSNG